MYCITFQQALKYVSDQMPVPQAEALRQADDSLTPSPRSLALGTSALDPEKGEFKCSSPLRAISL